MLDSTGQMAVPWGWKCGDVDLISTSTKDKVFKIANKYGIYSQAIYSLFEEMNTAKNGLITKEELSWFMSEKGKDKPQVELQRIFEKADKNKDQRICFEEFIDLIGILEASFGYWSDEMEGDC